MKDFSPGAMAASVNEHLLARLDGFVVWGRRHKVQKAGAIIGTAAVDHAPIRQAERQRATSLGSLAGGGEPPAGHFPFVLDDLFSCGNRLMREQRHAIHGERRAMPR